jgi:CheY-like chemotaxis protein/HPt (histidine-containing phosphotransfer) domain-containing protein
MSRQRDTGYRQRAASRRSRLLARRTASAAGDTAKSAFLSVVSHELRTPLHTILGQADLLANDILPPHAMESVEAIRSAGQGLYAILNDILELARLESGAAPAETADIDIRTLVDGVRRLNQPRAWAQSLDLEVTIDRSVPQRLRGDAGRIRQTLVNLTGNALKFTERGGVSIIVTMAGPELLKISVSDTGIGIAPHELERVFAAFEQGDGGLTRHHGGMGLGLALCRRLVDAMGGRIGVDSTPGSGSTFWFTAPVRAAESVGEQPCEADDPEAAGPGLLAQLKGLRVLAADDNPLHRQSLNHIFDSAGIQADMVEDGLQAVEAAGRKPYDIVMLDAHMPILGGIQAAQMIRALHQKQQSTLIVLACPGGDQAEADAEGLCDGVVVKPYGERQVLEMLAKLSGGSRDQTPAFDAAGIVELEKSVGRPVLVDILSSYMSMAEDMLARIEAALPGSDMGAVEQAARDLAGAASGLGLTALTAAARELSQSARRGGDIGMMASNVSALAELSSATHRQLASLYPDVAKVAA